MRTQTGKRAKQPEDYARNFDGFWSLFDAAALGQYFGGIDPRNGSSKPGFVNEDCLFNPVRLMFEWEFDQKGRDVPFACFGQTRYRINNLHVHSKNLKAFRS